MQNKPPPLHVRAPVPLEYDPYELAKLAKSHGPKTKSIFQKHTHNKLDAFHRSKILESQEDSNQPSGLPAQLQRMLPSSITSDKVKTKRFEAYWLED